MVVFVGKLEVVHKQGGGDLISYNLQHSSVRKIEVILPFVRARAASITLESKLYVKDSIPYAKAAKNLK